MISCVFSLVKVIPHEICSAIRFFDKKENIVGSTSPGCLSSSSQFIDFPFNRGGVPVFNLPNFKPKSSIFSASFDDGFAPIRPAGYETSPMKTFPRRNVPVVIMVDFAKISEPSAKIIPITSSCEPTRSTTSPSTMERFSIDFKALFIEF